VLMQGRKLTCIDEDDVLERLQAQSDALLERAGIRVRTNWRVE
jgi:hypothetical protein